MNVWILQTGEPLHCDLDDSRPMRAINLANALVDLGHHVTLWSSCFYHQKKCHRSLKRKIINISPLLEIRLIPSPGYKRNIGLDRLWDHAVLAYNLKNWLSENQSPPDVAFIGYPPIEVAAIMTKWLSARNVPSLLDVKDQWPDIFINAFPKKLKRIGSILLYPYFFLAKNTMRSTNGIVTMAQGFLEWTNAFAERSVTQYDIISPLTPPPVHLSKIDLQQAKLWWETKGINTQTDESIFRIIFIGTLSSAFDFSTIADAAKILLKTNNNIQFIICGDGPKKTEIENLMKGIPNIYFPGWIDSNKIKVLASYSNVFIAPYRNTDDFIRSIPNKILDALSLGLPIITPLSGEVEILIKKNELGLYYTDAQSLADSINTLYQDKKLIKQMSANSAETFKNQFSFEKVYSTLACHLEKIALLNTH